MNEKPPGGGVRLRNQQAKEIAERIFGELWREFHPLACQQVVRNLERICARELKTTRVQYQQERAEGK